jgi:exonuclease SbcC
LDKAEQLVADSAAWRSDATARLAAAERHGAELLERARSLPVRRVTAALRRAVPDGGTFEFVALPDDIAPAAEILDRWSVIAAGAVAAVERLAAEAREAVRGAWAEAAALAAPVLEGTPVAGPPGDPAWTGDVERLESDVRAVSRDLLARSVESRHAARTVRGKLQERRRLEQEIATSTAEAALYGALAQEFRADRLIAFLQGEALEMLARAGSHRLLFLSQGRYGLMYEGDEFFVEDRHAGDERRSVRTLSGGETFLASLALALALAEQIHSLALDRAPLESLFIDEGFGALDAQTLEVATEALGQLGGDGRLVGVITHVPELAERMPTRVRVERTPRGSVLDVAS